MDIRGFILPKEGELFSSCQDRFCVNSDTKSIAISDGTTSGGLYQGLWADLLVNNFTKKESWDAETIKGITIDWRQKVLDKLEYRKKENDPYVDYAEELFYTGGSYGYGYATFCGVKFLKNNKIECYVIGDSCLFVIGKDYTIKNIYPQSIEKKGFGNRPDLLISNKENVFRGEMQKIQSTIEVGDRVLLVTDALAEFIWKNRDKIDIIKEVLKINSHKKFSQFVNRYRADKTLHIDDTTLVIINNIAKQDVKECFIDNIDDFIDFETKIGGTIDSYEEIKNEWNDIYKQLNIGV
ncbi:MAG: hypothetical protein IJ213_03685 [Bacteroidales bacterium]|nr:hypothetical protein [Bacteroidales bacterium]